MIDSQLKPCGIVSPRVVGAFFAVVAVGYGIVTDWVEPVGWVALFLSAGLGFMIAFFLWNTARKLPARPDDEEDGDDLTVRSLSPDPEDIEDDLWLAHDHVEHLAARAHAWVDASHEWPLVWQEEAGLHDFAVLVDEEQLVALRTELGELMARYRRIGAGTPGARRVAVTVAIHPIDRAPTSPQR